MKPSTHDNAKRKRRASETGTLVGVRLQSDLLADLDAYRESLPDSPSRPEAIREIVRVMFYIMKKDR